METFRLNSMVDFVLENAKQPYVEGTKYKDLVNYAKFLKQPLNLGMFVPCDKIGNVLEEPKRWKDYLQYPDSFDGNNEWYELYDYHQAKEKVLFDGIEFERIGGINFLKINDDTFAFHDFNIKFKNLTVEFLVQYNLQLTESAIKQIGL